MLKIHFKVIQILKSTLIVHYDTGARSDYLPHEFHIVFYITRA